MRIKVKEIELEQLETFEENYDYFDEEIDAGVGVSFLYEKMRQRFCVSVGVRLVQSRKPLLSARLQCNFAFAEELMDSFIKNGVLSIPQCYCMECASITYNTLRGVVYGLTRRMLLNSAILPVFDFSAVVKDGFVAEID